MKTLIALAGLIVLTNAWMLASAWWNRTLVRSEFELNERYCSVYRDEHKGGPAEMRCGAADEGPRRTDNHPHARPRSGYALLETNADKARLTAFARSAETLEGESKIVVPAESHPDWGLSMVLPPMTLAPSMPVPRPREEFRARICIGRNYEPWLVELRTGN